MARYADIGRGDALVKDVRDAIARWRRTRERRTAMPAELWAAATAVARTHGPYRAARALGVDYMSLARRVAEGGGIGRTDGAPSADFVELRGVDLIGRATVVELSDGDGSRMRIQVGAGSTLAMAAGLVGAFRGRAA